MAPIRSIDLNADVGEATDEAGIEVERTLLGLVTSVHVACGGHAGDDDSMTATVAAALEHGVRVGAHPSYPDRVGFGRAPLEIDRAELGASLADQLQALQRIGRKAGTTVDSVKAHGALYVEVAKGGAVYETFRDAVRRSVGDDASLVLPSGCRATAMALRDGMRSSEEGFCDRAYRGDGGLVDRSTPGAVVEDPAWPPRRRSAWPAARWSLVTAACSRSGWTPCASMPIRQALSPSPRRFAGSWRDAGIDVHAPAPA